MKYFLDTNIISYYLKGNDSIETRIADLLRGGNTVQVPVVTYYEARRGLLAIGASKKLLDFEDFIEFFPIQDMTRHTFILASEIYSDLYKKGQIIEDADIFIGATALENDAILVTNNEKHLGRIDGLKLEVWR